MSRMPSTRSLLSALVPEMNGKVCNIGGTGTISLRRLADTLIEVHGGGSYKIREFPADRKRSTSATTMATTGCSAP